MSELLLESVFVCPGLRLRQRETTPTGSCQFFYECTGCQAVLRPKPGDCCVFCSYGSVRCPQCRARNVRVEYLDDSLCARYEPQLEAVINHSTLTFGRV
jgi:hypothetical protein